MTGLDRFSDFSRIWFKQLLLYNYSMVVPITFKYEKQFILQLFNLNSQNEWTIFISDIRSLTEYDAVLTSRKLHCCLDVICFKSKTLFFETLFHSKFYCSIITITVH